MVHPQDFWWGVLHIISDVYCWGLYELTVDRWVLKIHSVCLGMHDLSTYLDICRLVPKRRQEMTRCSQNDIMEHFCSLNRNAFASETLPISSIYIIETNKFSIPSYVCYISLHLPCKSTINVCECNLRPMDGTDGCQKVAGQDRIRSLWKHYFMGAHAATWCLLEIFMLFFGWETFATKMREVIFSCFLFIFFFASEMCRVLFRLLFSGWEFFQVKFVKLFIRLVWGICLFWNNRWIKLTY